MPTSCGPPLTRSFPCIIDASFDCSASPPSLLVSLHKDRQLPFGDSEAIRGERSTDVGEPGANRSSVLTAVDSHDFELPASESASSAPLDPPSRAGIETRRKQRTLGVCSMTSFTPSLSSTRAE